MQFPPLPNLVILQFENALPQELRAWFRAIMDKFDEEPSREKRILEAVQHAMNSQNEGIVKICQFLEPMSATLQAHVQWEPHLVRMDGQVQGMVKALGEGSDKSTYVVQGLESVCGGQKELKKMIREEGKERSVLEERIRAIEAHLMQRVETPHKVMVCKR